MNVAIIPARGGSKRIPRKNVKDFAGKPLISYSINAARESGVFDRIIVSTDSREIIDIALEFGAEVPFTRPAEFSDDKTPTAPVLKHTLEWMNSNGEEVDNFCCVYATAPFLRACDIKKAFDILLSENAPEVFSVATFSFPIFRALRVSESGILEMFWPENELTRSQDLPEAYQDAGQFYWFNADEFLKCPKIWHPGARPLIIPRYLVQDIDTEEDWKTAELLHFTAKERGLL